MAYSVQDEQVQATNDDASTSKCSAVQLGYWHDPYISHFVKPSTRRLPEMNRGYYARVKAIESITKQFLQMYKNKCQVVVLGAGFDTSYWNLSEDFPLSWVEVDFGPVISRKIRCILTKKLLQDKLNLHSEELELKRRGSKEELHTTIYHCVSCDLRNLSQFEHVLKEKCGLKFDLPTLFVAECVLVYMEGEESDRLIKWISSHFNHAMFVNYEQIGMEDTFGEVMKRNLKSRGLGLVGVVHCSSLQSQIDRFLKNGWDGAQGADLMDIYRGMSPQELHRIEKLEMLDEMEMFGLLLEHYCVVWAFVGGENMQSITLTTRKKIID